jgi:tetratricopeptide (TPR) repeat protein
MANAPPPLTPMVPPVADTSTLEMGGVTLRPGDAIGAYRYIRPIGKGGMADVLLAADPGGRQIALKVLKADRFRTGIDRFRREFRALSRVDHPNVIRVEAYGDIHGHPYIAMEFVEGRDLHQAMRTIRRLPVEERWVAIERVLVDLCNALLCIHQRGLVHRDLKPSNVLVDAAGSCKLTDFGIVKTLDPASDPFVSQTLVGTWAYASPEQITGRPLDHRSDLYSLGVILYTLLTGRRPFVASDMAGYLELHSATVPTAPRDVDPEVPAALDEVCQRLLRKEPRDRYQSAQDVLYRLQPEVPVVVDDGPRLGFEPPLVGRDAALQQLQNAVAALSRGEGGVCLIEGEDGSGRSTLLARTVLQAKRLGFPVHAARLAPSQGSFEVLLGLANQIGRELGDNVPGELNRAMGVFARDEGRVPGNVRYQLYDGVRDALGRLLAEGPRVLAVDDLHLAPPALLELVGYVVRSVVARDGQPLLVVAATRWPDGNPALRAFRDGTTLGVATQRVEVLPLSPDEVRDLAVGLVGADRRAPQLARLLSKHTGGLPLFLVEYLRALMDQGQLAPVGDGTLRIDGDLGALGKRGMAVPVGVRRVLDGPLVREERDVIDAVATAGREVELELLLDVLDPPDEDALLDCLDRLVDGGLLVEHRTGAQVLYDLKHRVFGDAALERLSPTERADLHRRFGAALEARHASSPASAEAIAEHYERAGDPVQAFRWLSTAALRLWERSLLAEAWEMAERARELSFGPAVDLTEPGSRKAWLSLVRVRADAVYNRGDWAMAQSALSELVVATGDSGDTSAWGESSLQLGTVERRLGDEERGRARIRAVLARARELHDRNLIVLALRHLAGISWEDGDLDATEQYAAEGLLLASGPELSHRRAEMLISLTAVQASQGQLAAAIAGLAEADALLRGLRDKRSRVIILCNLAELMVWRGDLDQALGRAEDALQLSDAVMFREGRETALRVRALALLEVGDDERAEVDLLAALALAQSLDLPEDQVSSRYLLGRLALRLHDLADARLHFEAGLREAERRDPEQYGPALRARLAQVLALEGNGPAARAALAVVVAEVDALPIPRRTEVFSMISRACEALGDSEGALVAARTAARLASSRGLRPWHIAALGAVGRLGQGAEAERANLEAQQAVADLVGSWPVGLVQKYRSRPSIQALTVLPP